jgi:hypothetical protein
LCSFVTWSLCGKSRIFLKIITFSISTLFDFIEILMNKIFAILFPVILAASATGNIYCQHVDSASFKIYSRLSFYSSEKKGEFLLHIPSGKVQSQLSVTITTGDKTIATWNGKPERKILRIPFVIDFPPSAYRVTAKISLSREQGQIYLAATECRILTYKVNEVKTDRLTGGMIVNRRQFFPYGFYCYSPVSPTLPEEEVVRGFNMISPYQTILPETLNERKAYMDRCAELGLKVHYNLISLSGSGGVNSQIGNLTAEEKKVRLIQEIKTFMNHPALLAWYISDEPNGFKIPPETLEETYKTVRETDPWHPVSMVFMAPFISSRMYAEALDIVMADPYPVPNSPIAITGDVAAQLKTEFSGKRSVWMVLQAFGGGEWWGREPTVQELRSMTWQSVIGGATGIQYFVRQGLNYFPKSVAAWNECGRMAMEIAEVTPWLLSDEETLPVESTSRNIVVTSRVHEGQLMIMAANKINEPVAVTFRISGFSNGRANLIFENRLLPVTGGQITDHLAPFGSQVYLINLRPSAGDLVVSPENLLRDPGFEDNSSPGVPSACYARPGGDKGATYFLDTREHHDGNHSLRLLTPDDNKGIALRMFPFRVKAGSSYAISVWAKSDPEQRLFFVTNQDSMRLSEKHRNPQYVEIELGAFGKARFVPDQEWRRFMTFITIPSDTLKSFRTNLIIKMTGQGVAWFDELKVFEEKSRDN